VHAGGDDRSPLAGLSGFIWLSVYAVHIGATWQIGLNCPCAAAIWHYVKLL